MAAGYSSYLGKGGQLALALLCGLQTCWVPKAASEENRPNPVRFGGILEGSAEVVVSGANFDEGDGNDSRLAQLGLIEQSRHRLGGIARRDGRKQQIGSYGRFAPIPAWDDKAPPKYNHNDDNIKLAESAPAFVADDAQLFAAREIRALESQPLPSEIRVQAPLRWRQAGTVSFGLTRPCGGAADFDAGKRQAFRHGSGAALPETARFSASSDVNRRIYLPAPHPGETARQSAPTTTETDYHGVITSNQLRLWVAGVMQF